MSRIEVVAPNFKKRLSGVTSTIIQLVPLQARMLGIATLGPGLPESLPKIRWWQVPLLLKRPQSGRKRIWHARRNVEMLAGLVLKAIFRAPLLLVFTSASQRRHKRWTRFLIRRMDGVIATSRKTAAYLTVPNTVVMHGIDTVKFAPPPDRDAAVEAVGLERVRNYVGCFGRVRHQKGTDLFVDAMIGLLPSRPGWSAVIAGRATAQHAAFEQELKARVATAGLSERILFVGEHSDIARWYKALALFVAPQRWEGFGLTPLEAMATGVPVVAADVGAFSELIEEGVTGQVIPRDDLAAMTKAAGRLMDDDVKRDAAGRASLERASKLFALQGEAEAIGAFYQKVWSTG
ncbi:glycosyltransferase family 1 protein [Pseudaminobacter arsenicus]|uniref:Glycosyltransferase family 1 protein n=1 Tax=Borborobacter arsenicus TaxID=1851146 RepID=A0A432V4D1_9HYPH|nr:glycosyltransferase family 4 protein [Pseudaminobacter arsenicus]RUM97007.1 glycosyltransferase family 1 protein [Pseudaminobacter arsenicus]